jgi:hypothetical protein
MGGSRLEPNLGTSVKPYLKNKLKSKDRGCGLVHLPSKCKALSSNPGTANGRKEGMKGEFCGGRRTRLDRSLRTHFGENVKRAIRSGERSELKRKIGFRSYFFGRARLHTPVIPALGRRSMRTSSSRLKKPMLHELDGFVDRKRRGSR